MSSLSNYVEGIFNGNKSSEKENLENKLKARLETVRKKPYS